MPISRSSPDKMGGLVGWRLESFCLRSPGTRLGYRAMTVMGSGGGEEEEEEGDRLGYRAMTVMGSGGGGGGGGDQVRIQIMGSGGRELEEFWWYLLTFFDFQVVFQRLLKFMLCELMEGQATKNLSATMSCLPVTLHDQLL